MLRRWGKRENLYRPVISYTNTGSGPYRFSRANKSNERRMHLDDRRLE